MGTLCTSYSMTGSKDWAHFAGLLGILEYAHLAG